MIPAIGQLSEKDISISQENQFFSIYQGPHISAIFVLNLCLLINKAAHELSLNWLKITQSMACKQSLNIYQGLKLCKTRKTPISIMDWFFH